MIGDGYHVGDCRELLRQLDDGCVQTCVTSPPYWGLRDYGVDGQLGLEPTPEAYIAAMVEVFREVRRVLRTDGTLWLNIGDSYVTNPRGPNGQAKSTINGSADRRARRWEAHPQNRTVDPKAKGRAHRHASNRGTASGLKHKDLVGIPWMLAFALRADGWWLRMDVIWHKPSPMPEPVTDRPTRAHEYLFLLSKAPRYFYDADAIREPLREKTLTTYGSTRQSKGTDAIGKVASDNWARDVPVRKPKLNDEGAPVGANRRSVWTIASEPLADAHFATFPRKLVEPCILAGSRPRDLVLDPFGGSGTVGRVAGDLGRRWILFDLNPAYAEIAERRLDMPLFPITPEAAS